MATPLRTRARKTRIDPARMVLACHALSDETRIAILDRLRNGEQCVCNLMDVLGAGQSRLSFHMKALKDAGLVRDRRDGRWIHYSLNVETFDAVAAFVASFGGGKNGPGDVSCCKK